jgi:hypothetical protein
MRLNGTKASKVQGHDWTKVQVVNRALSLQCLVCNYVQVLVVGT